MRHWLTRFDPNDGEPYGALCDCEIGVDHDGDGDPMFTEAEDLILAALANETAAAADAPAVAAEETPNPSEGTES